jgi:PAS domain S-box-containing protein
LAFAAAAVLAAMLCRMALDPVLGDQFPFITLLVAVFVVAVYAGRVPALLAVGLGAAASARFLLQPRDSIMVYAFSDRVGLTIYVIFGTAIAFVGGALRASRARAKESAFEVARERDGLRVREEALRLLMEHAPVAIAMFDREMRYVVVSRRWREDFGLGEGEVLGRSQYEVMPDIAERWRQSHGRCMAGAVERFLEDSYIGPDGAEQWIRWECRPWLDGGGRIGGIIIFSEVITEARQSRRTIEEHAETLGGILSASVDQLFIIDRRGRYLHVSESAADGVGLKPADMVGKDWRALGFSAEVMTEFDQLRDEVFRSGRPCRHEVRIGVDREQTRDVEYTIAPVSRAGRPADAVVVVARDITKYKIDEQERSLLLNELERQNAFMNAVLRQVPAAIVVADATTGKLLMSNEESHRIVRHEYHAGRLLEDYGNEYIVKAFRPDGTHYLAGQWPLDQALRGQTVVGAEIELLRSDRSKLTIRVNAGPIRIGEEVVAAVVAFHDITQRKEIEKTARFLADASAAIASLQDREQILTRIVNVAVPTFAEFAAVVTVGPDGSFQTVAMAEADPEKIPKILEMERRYPLQRNEAHAITAVVTTGRSQLIREISDEMLRGMAKDEEHFERMRELAPISSVCVPMILRGDTLGVITFVSETPGRYYTEHDLAVAEDLAARVVTAIENARLYGELEEADQNKTRFLATLAHELRNPLAPIRNALHLLRMPSLSVEGSESVRVMAERQVVHLARLIDDLMDVARISRGRIELSKGLVDVATIVNQAVETSRQQFDERGHQLTVSLPAEPVFLEADATRLEQILWNLLNNAAKYSKPGGRIELTVARSFQDVVIRLKDSGIGIRREMLGRVFGMFVQVGDHKEHAQGGLGIGLSLVRTLVEMHGGTITAHSDGPGTGSEFVVTLPVSQAATGRANSRGNAGAIGRHKLPCRRVLIVDDNVDGATSLAKLLQLLHGHEVFLAHDGPAALDSVDQVRPDVILLDIGLPTMSGYEVARAARQRARGQDLLILALTGWGQETDRRASKEAGIDYHLVKPVDIAELERILAERWCVVVTQGSAGLGGGENGA